MFWGLPHEVGSLAFSYLVLKRTGLDKQAKHLFKAQELLKHNTEAYAVGYFIKHMQETLNSPKFKNLSSKPGPGVAPFTAAKIFEVAECFVSSTQLPVSTIGGEDTAQSAIKSSSLLQFRYQYYKESVSDANGFGVIRSYRIMHPFLIGSGAKKYRSETFRHLLGIFGDLSQHDAFVSLHDRFINRSGRKGHNCEIDLSQEHIM